MSQHLFFSLMIELERSINVFCCLVYSMVFAEFLESIIWISTKKWPGEDILPIDKVKKVVEKICAIK